MCILFFSFGILKVPRTYPAVAKPWTANKSRTLLCAAQSAKSINNSLSYVSNLLTLHPHSPHRCTYSYPTHPGRQLNRAPALPFSPISVPPPHTMPSSMQCTSKIGRRKVPYITYITKLTLPAPPNQSISLSSQNSNLALLYLDMRSGPW